MSEVKIHRNLSSIDLKMIAAMDLGGGIGNNGMLPWPPHKGDFKRFKEITNNSVVIMGRKTFEEIEKIRTEKDPESTELLPGRTCVVVSSKTISTKFNVFVVTNLLNAVKYYYEETKSVFVVGGLQLYTEALPYVNTLYITMFDQYYECDRYLPLKYLTQHFNIVDGTQEDGVKYLKCQRVTL